MNITEVGKFYLGNGGIGDALLFLSTFYDEVETANVIFLANDISAIQQLFKIFPKLKKTLVLKNDFKWLNEFYYHPNCIGTGILPKNLDYSNWYRVNIFKEYGVVEFPKFVDLIESHNYGRFQVYHQAEGSAVEGGGKLRRVPVIRNFQLEYPNCIVLQSQLESIRDVLGRIKGSDLVVGTDSFAKTFGAMCGKKVICYDNQYSESYLDRFKERTDYGHYVFIYPWSKIEFISNEKSHQETWAAWRREHNLPL